MNRLPESGYSWLFLSVLVLLAGIILAVCSWDWLRSGGPESASNGETLRNAGLLIGGALAFVFAGWRAWVAARQSTTAQVEAATAQLQAEIAQKGLLNERYERGAEMLGSSILPVRLGGVYALRRLAEEHPEQYHVQVMQLFCAFVRNPVEISGIVELSPIDLEPPHGAPPLREDVQAIMDVIAARREDHLILEKEVRFCLNLRGSDLRGARLNGANLTSATWEDNTGLTTSEMLALPMQTDLSDSRLCSAKLALAKAQRADLTGACLCDAFMTHTDLSGANLSGAELHQALSWGPILSGTSLNRGRPAKGIRQSDFDLCQADPDNLPVLAGVHDVEKGELVVWSGQPLGDGK